MYVKKYRLDKNIQGSNKNLILYFDEPKPLRRLKRPISAAI